MRFYQVGYGAVYPETNAAAARSGKPVAVIDPEDPESVNRLADAICRTEFVANAADDDLAAALREFANPKPPKPEEPTGLGAVVEDEGGTLWVQEHAPAGGISNWRSLTEERWRFYADIDVAIIHFAGARAAS